MMNTVIRQIVDLDKRAVKIKEGAAARAEQIVSDTKNEMKDKASQILQEARDQSKSNYDVEIQRANEEKERILASAQDTVMSVRGKYEENKVANARKVLDELFRSI
ncbi:MAG: hypothetical protein Q4C55_04205 [Eubacterium sp.]|nr:hypothetical protein [Eubacterium sp.]